MQQRQAQRVSGVAQREIVSGSFGDLHRLINELQRGVVGRDVGRAEESLTVTTLGNLDTDAIDMKCLLLVGASTTRATPAGRVWTPRWVR